MIDNPVEKALDAELAPLLSKGVKRQVPMAEHTSWQVGGPAQYFLNPESAAELAEIVRFKNRFNLPLFVFGNGSNLLVLDGGIKGLVVKIGEAFDWIRYEGDLIEAGAGTALTRFVIDASSKGYGGFEFLAGIPGTLGGAAIMNAGAFGGHIGEWIEGVTIIRMTSEEAFIPKAELTFSYRKSNLPELGVVTSIKARAVMREPEDGRQKIEHYMAERHHRHPVFASAGSVFRNPKDIPAGKLIESAGGKGLKIGGAEVSRQHANFIINLGEAQASHILALIEEVQRMVKDVHGYELHPEVKIVGEV